jgi:hypothetical protein
MTAVFTHCPRPPCRDCVTASSLGLVAVYTATALDCLGLWRHTWEPAYIGTLAPALDVLEPGDDRGSQRPGHSKRKDAEKSCWIAIRPRSRC